MQYQFRSTLTKTLWPSKRNEPKGFRSIVSSELRPFCSVFLLRRADVWNTDVELEREIEKKERDRSSNMSRMYRRSIHQWRQWGGGRDYPNWRHRIHLLLQVDQGCIAGLPRGNFLQASITSDAGAIVSTRRQCKILEIARPIFNCRNLPTVCQYTKANAETRKLRILESIITTKLRIMDYVGPLCCHWHHNLGTQIYKTAISNAVYTGVKLGRWF